MNVTIKDQILEKYPNTQIGYLVTRVSVTKTDPFVEDLKLKLAKEIHALGVNATNFATHPNIEVWRKIYQEDFGVKAKTYRSSIESLLRRIVTGKKIWDICSVVDLYNCHSILSLMPMGGYDLNKISGDITIRMGRAGDNFFGLGMQHPVEVKSNHVIYADQERTLCWLWNHKDAAATSINETTREVVFFIDSVQKTDPDVLSNALKTFACDLEKINCTPLRQGILNINSPSAILV